MPFTKIVPHPHKCNLPKRGDVNIGVGSIWQCEECKQEWRLTETAPDIALISRLSDNGWPEMDTIKVTRFMEWRKK